MGGATLRKSGHIRYFTPSGLRQGLSVSARPPATARLVAVPGSLDGRPDEKVWHCSVYFIYFSLDTIIEFCMRQSKMFSDVEWEVLLSIKSLNEILEVF
jgi:hypothetical protein